MDTMNERNRKDTEGREVMELKGEEEPLFSMDTLLSLTETIATMVIGGSFLLLVAVCLSVL